MTISEKIEQNKMDQNKAQNDLDRQTAKISALSSTSGNVSKYQFLTGKDVLPERLFRKSCQNEKI